jgi:outer membrane lipoprotein SlyB
MPKIFPTVITAFVLSLSLSACASLDSKKPNVVQPGDTQRMERVRTGLVLDVTEVTIAGDSKIGTAVGAVLGGVIGSQATRTQGSGTRAAGGVGGAVAGGVLGNKLGGALTNKKGVQLLIEFENKDVMSIVQEADPNITFEIGQTVRIIGDVKMRIIPVS